MTDALQSYNGLEKEYIHGVIDHAEKYVEGNIHTNGIENFWTLLKRASRAPTSASSPSTCSATWTKKSSASTTERPAMVSASCDSRRALSGSV